MPDVRNCRKCGKVYTYIGGPPICPVCSEKDETDFKQVKEYLYNNPGASMSEVSTALDVSVEKITRYLREGRLEIVGGDGNLILECESCGKSIKTGRFCQECQKELTKDFKSTARQMNESLPKDDDVKRSVEMRFLNKNERK
jgi:flagellar operon protein (TIGR03826 family)